MNKDISHKINACIVFVDIRGFTQWSEHTQVFEHSPKFIQSFYSLLDSHFGSSHWQIKTLGDGAVLVLELDQNQTTDFQDLLSGILSEINKINIEFETECKSFAKLQGQKTNLTLGWGITRGTVNKIESVSTNKPDYLGPDLNKAARLCDIARPFGIVIDRDDFQDKPLIDGYEFFQQERHLKSLSSVVSVWVTKEIAETFHPREELRETPEVHVAGICFKGDKSEPRILISRRKETRKLYPRLYEGCGGQLRLSERFEDGVKRHYKTELGIEVEVIPSINRTYVIEKADEPIIPGIAFLCKYISGSPSSDNHDLFEWKTIREIEAMNTDLFIKDVKDEILDFIKRYQN